MRWIAAHTWLLALIPLIAGILLCYYTNFPTNLLADTAVDYLNRDTILRLHLVSEGDDRSKTVRYTTAAEDGSRVFLYLQRDSLSQPRMGDILLVQTTVQRGDTIGNFDYGKYLRLQGIVGTAWANRRNWQVIGHEPIRGLRAKAEQCQHWLHQRYIQLGLHDPELGVLSALTLGYREELDAKVQQSFSTAGAMHVLAVSGLHTGIVWSIIVGLLTLGGIAKPSYDQRCWQSVLTMFTLVALWIYAFITGLSPSVMRSALMVTVVELGWLFRRYSLSINSLSAAAVIILLINPLALWSVSFQLSFAAVAAIILVTQGMQRRVIIHGRIWQYIGGLLIMSLAAQIGTLPLTLHYFGQTSNYFAITNLVVIPAAFLLLLLGIGSLAMSWCILGTWLGQAAQWCTYGLRVFVEWIEQLPYASTHIELNSLAVILCYGAIGSALIMLRGDKVKWWWLIGVVGCLAGIVITNSIKVV